MGATVWVTVVLRQVGATVWVTVVLPRVLSAYLCDRFDSDEKAKVP